jgi:hypothetical protein
MVEGGGQSLIRAVRSSVATARRWGGGARRLQKVRVLSVPQLPTNSAWEGQKATRVQGVVWCSNVTRK